MERLLTLYSEVQSTDVRWLWYPFIAIGKITLLQGDPGDGKSTMMMNLIAELSTGGKTPDGCKIGAPQKVIYQCSEDGVSDTIKPRLERYGADCRKIALRLRQKTSAFPFLPTRAFDGWNAGHSFLKNNSRTPNLNLIQSNRKLPTGLSIFLKKAI